MFENSSFDCFATLNAIENFIGLSCTDTSAIRRTYRYAYVWDKVALKVRQYNVGMNADQLSAEVKQAKGLNAAADAYRKASDGE